MSPCSKELAHVMVRETGGALGGTGAWPAQGPGCQPAPVGFLGFSPLCCGLQGVGTSSVLGASWAAGKAGAAISGCKYPSVPLPGR